MNVPNQKVIIVLGMHRSGTSAFSGMLHHLGVNFGKQLMTPVKNINDKGFFEHIGINKIHDAILKTLKYHWSDLRPLPVEWWKTPAVRAHKAELKQLIEHEFGQSPLWGMKDPRVCRLLPVWLEILDEMKIEPLFLFCMRHPDEVAKSLHHRDKMNPFASYFLWLWHVLTAEKLTRTHTRSIVFYSDLLRDWYSISNKLGQEFDLGWPVSPDRVSNDVSEFLDGSLRHYMHLNRQSDLKVGQLANQTYNAFRQGQLEMCNAIEYRFRGEVLRHQRKFIFINYLQIFKEIYMSHLRAIHGNSYQYFYKIISRLAIKFII